jgi:hypothetical protein
MGIGDFLYDNKITPRIFYLFRVEDKHVTEHNMAAVRDMPEYLDDYIFTNVEAYYPSHHKLSGKRCTFHMLVLKFPHEIAFTNFLEGKYRNMYGGEWTLSADHKMTTNPKKLAGAPNAFEYIGIASTKNKAYYAMNGLNMPHKDKEDYLMFLRGELAEEYGVSPKDMAKAFTNTSDELDIKPILSDEIFNYHNEK